MRYAVRVVTRNFVRDIQSDVLNFFGRRLTPYEEIIKGAIDDCLKELSNPENCKIEIAEIAGAFTIVVFCD